MQGTAMAELKAKVFKPIILFIASITSACTRYAPKLYLESFLINALTEILLKLLYLKNVKTAMASKRIPMKKS